MYKQTLHENWRMREAGGEWQEARVPGTVYTDLLRNGKMEDPYWKYNEDQALALMEKDYEYETVFCWDRKEEGERIWLQFLGLDTIADIYVNQIPVGSAKNMHRIWEYDVTDALREGENTLRVYFHSPLAYIRQEFAKCPTRGSEDAMDGFVHIRKAHCMFGWDWGAHLPDAGIYRPVSLLAVKKGRMDSVRIHQEHMEGRADLHLEVTWNPADDLRREIPAPGTGVSYQVTVTAPDGTVISEENSPEKITVENPQLWWPNGVGDQPLYQVQVKLYLDGELADIWERRIGLRTMTMHIEKDQWGSSFAHQVNGKCIFAMGADYIPEDHLLGRVTAERTRELLLQCKEANFNTVRVWGGGYYPEDWFYDACDELGLMVWEDFMFACAVYELTPEFEENIREEFRDNIKRLRHHASLGLWCGNNEMEQFVKEGNWVSKPSEVRDYLLMYERIIPEMLEKYDPDTFYWPASPSSGGSFDDPQDPNRGDVHFWQVWHGNKPFTEYRKYFFRYVSEFGFQSFPSLKTIQTFTDDPKDWNIFSYVMEKHQRNAGANGKILGYLQQTYRYPEDFTDLLYTSQLLQAEAIKFGVEHFRRNRGRCMGAVYWQLNDCWPVASWASIDYCGRWKALHYYARRFFAPVMISCEEQGWMSAEADMNREHFAFEKSIRLNVTNETLQDREILVKWALRNADAGIVEEHQEMVRVPALSSVWMEKRVFDQLDYFSQYVSFEAWEAGTLVSEGTVIFSYPKYFRYQDPRLSCRVEGDEIVVKADAYAKSVEILNEEEDLILSDNYFDMNAGEKRVKVLNKDKVSLDNLRLRSVYDI